MYARSCNSLAEQTGVDTDNSTSYMNIKIQRFTPLYFIKQTVGRKLQIFISKLSAAATNSSPQCHCLNRTNAGWLKTNFKKWMVKIYCTHSHEIIKKKLKKRGREIGFKTNLTYNITI